LSEIVTCWMCVGRLLFLNPIYSIREVQQSTAIELVNEEVTVHCLYLITRVAWIWKRTWSQEFAGIEFTLLMWWDWFGRKSAHCKDGKNLWFIPWLYQLFKGTVKWSHNIHFPKHTFNINSKRILLEKQKAAIFASN